MKGTTMNDVFRVEPDQDIKTLTNLIQPKYIRYDGIILPGPDCRIFERDEFGGLKHEVKQ